MSAPQKQQALEAGQIQMLPATTPISGGATKVDVDRKSVKLDDLGPMVVNSDGTLSRVANWSDMTQLEQDRTLRVLGARNQLRLANEEQKLDNDGSGRSVDQHTERVSALSRSQ
ncbi:hypothetical protein AX15_004741 [Amanita polypyramis BW_CC]|nr:hypothetical protein AX15_004741 [Amanita polypyramis BW_CC]